MGKQPLLDLIRTPNDRVGGRGPDGYKCRVCPAAGDATIAAVWKPISSPPQVNSWKFGLGFDPARENQLRTARRATAKVRRYAVANRLEYMWTFTYRVPQLDWSAAGEDWAHFIRRHRRRHGPHPYLWVREVHEENPAQGLHLHALFGQRFPWSELAQDWGRGHVLVKPYERSQNATAAEDAARYLSKRFANIDTDLARIGTARPKGGHRFGSAKDFTPEVIEYTTSSRDEAVSIANELAGRSLYFHTIPVSAYYNGPAFELARWKVNYTDN